MKTLRLTLISVLFCCFSNVSADEYYPLVEEGKVWEYYQSGILLIESERLYRMEFNGSTEIAGKLYKNLYLYFTPSLDVTKETPVAFMREEDRIVYAILNEEGMKIARSTPSINGTALDLTMFPKYTADEIVVYDFNNYDIPKLKSSSALSNYTVTEVDIEVTGGSRHAKRYSWQSGDESNYFFIIESIGHSGYSMGSLLNPASSYSHVYGAYALTMGLRCVYNKDGEIIYKSPRYDSMTVGVEEVKVDNSRPDGVYYNLMGQPVSNPSAGIYIRNGKKVVVK